MGPCTPKPPPPHPPYTLHPTSTPPLPILSHNICVTQLFLGPTISGTQYFVDQKFVNHLFFWHKFFWKPQIQKSIKYVMQRLNTIKYTSSTQQAHINHTVRTHPIFFNILGKLKQIMQMIEHFGGLSIVHVTFVHCVQLNFSEWKAKEFQLYCVYTAQLDWKAFPPWLDHMKHENWQWTSFHIIYFPFLLYT